MKNIEVIIEEVKCQLDAFDIYSIFKDEKNTIILDSGRDFEDMGRYSFIGVNPFLTFKGKGNKIDINNKKFEGNIFDELRKILNSYRISNPTEIPFIGGGIGYLSYDLGREIEEVPNTAIEDIDIPYIYYNFYDNLIIYDNLERKCYITALGILKEKNQSIDEIIKRILNGKKVEYKNVGPIRPELFKSNFENEEYLRSVNKVREYIKEGHIYIMNLTQRFTCECGRNPYEVYRDLRYINPAPFAAYMNLEGFSILSSSPERFLRRKNQKVETRPIKGTRPRGKTEEEDKENIEELMNSEKDKSELLMIVDLERNDLSRVCKPFTVKVPELFALESYATVHHLVSTVEGELKEENDTVELIKVCFPGGSITGAPKIRSMEIIEELEGIRRNIYTGSIGYIGFDGSMDLNIVIRTIHMENGKAYFGVGGGITWESECNFEYEETLHKAAALMRALGNGC